MTSNLEKEAAHCRQMAAEYGRRAEQETRPVERDFYFDLHRRWLRMAIVYEIEAEGLSQPVSQGPIRRGGLGTHTLG
jgi:hypothetical protein